MTNRQAACPVELVVRPSGAQAAHAEGIGWLAAENLPISQGTPVKGSEALLVAL